MTRRTTALAALGMVAGAACASTGQGTGDAATPGCYYFEQDASAVRALGLPWGVRLMQEDLDGWPLLQDLDGTRRARTLTGSTETDHPFNYWRPLEADSLLIGYAGGGGVALHVAPTDGGLTGVALPVGDATLAPERPRHPVRLLHARCPEEL